MISEDQDAAIKTKIQKQQKKCLDDVQSLNPFITQYIDLYFFL